MLKQWVTTPWQWFNQGCEWLAPLLDLFIRYWVASVFFYSGLTKIQTWSSTVSLFRYEYQVPLISPETAAYLGTAAELTLPVLLLLGLGGRIPALMLFIFNIAATVSYPHLWTSAGSEGLEDHFYWGILLAMTVLHGYGKLSLDYVIARWWWKSV